MEYKPDDTVKSCRKLESGLRLGIEGIHACQLGPFSSPIYWTAEEASKIKITKEMIAEKRKQVFMTLNDESSDIPCKQCHMVKTKLYKDVNFTRLGHIDLAPSTICNLRCTFCGYTMRDSFEAAKYDALAVLKEYSPDDVEWDSAVDFNGGEPSILPDVDKYLEYFKSRRIRVFLYTNAVKFRQSIYDGLVDGSIRWVCSSLDAGTPSSFLQVKQRDSFVQALENLTRYAHAGNMGSGKLAVKYIFAEGNCSDDNAAGFAYAMLAIRPQQIWLTFDFEPLSGLPADSDDFGGADYSKHIEAYAKMFRILKKHGITAGHFAENHLAVVSRHGKILLEKALEKIKELEEDEIPELILKDFRKTEALGMIETSLFRINPFQIKMPGQDYSSCSLKGKRIVLAPASQQAANLLNNPEIEQGQLLAFLDRDPVLQGKKIYNIPVCKYEDAAKLAPDIVLVASAKQHRNDIIQILIKNSISVEKIAAWEKD